MEFNHRPLYDTDVIAKHYSEKDGVDVTYVCTTALDNSSFAMDIFYRETPHPEFGNRYFGIYTSPLTGDTMITNADRVEDYEFTCSPGSNEQLVYSQHRHDMVDVYGGALDGGRAYFRAIGRPNLFTARVKDGIMGVIDNGESE